MVVISLISDRYNLSVSCPELTGFVYNCNKICAFRMILSKTVTYSKSTVIERWLWFVQLWGGVFVYWGKVSIQSVELNNAIKSWQWILQSMRESKHKPFDLFSASGLLVIHGVQNTGRMEGKVGEEWWIYHLSQSYTLQAVLPHILLGIFHYSIP